MKTFGKTLAALLSLAALTFGFVSCSDDDDDELKTIATFYGTGAEEGTVDEGVTYTFTSSIRATFYNNNEYKIDQNITGVVKGDSGKAVVSQDGTIEIGTYTGDPTKNGQIKLTATKEYDDETEKLVDVKEKTTETVEIEDGGKVTLDLNAEGELDEFGIDTFEITLTRQ